MATQDQKRSIVGAVTQKGKTYVSGEEAELAAVLDQGNIDRLVGKGVLAGDWSGASSAPEPKAAEDSAPEAPKPAKEPKPAKAKTAKPRAPKPAKGI